MKKIIVTILALLTTVLVFFIFFFKGTLIINPSEKPIDITIDKKVYKNKDSLTVKLSTGTHQVKIEKDDYKTYEENVKIGFMQKKEISPLLELTEEAQDRIEIEKISKEFAEAWYTYETQTNVDYLEKIRPFMTQDFYDETSYVNTYRKKDFEGEVPLTTMVTSTLITSYSGDEALVTIGMESNEPTTGNNYQQKSTLTLIKGVDKWLVSYIEPII